MEKTKTQKSHWPCRSGCCQSPLAEAVTRYQARTSCARPSPQTSQMSEHPERPWHQEKQILFLSNFRTSDICKISKLVLVVTLCHTSSALKFQKGNHIFSIPSWFFTFFWVYLLRQQTAWICLDLVRPVPHGIHLLYVGPSRSGWAHQTAFSIDSIGFHRHISKSPFL